MDKKKVLLMATSVALMSCVIGTFASTTINKSYTDKLTISFQKYAPDTMLYNSYQSNNGVNIVGPSFINTDKSALVKFTSKIQHGTGNPVMSMVFPRGTTKCVLTFVDGPHTNLRFKGHIANFCADMGLIVGPITKLNASNYTLTITNT